MIATDARKSMIESNHDDLSIVDQCELLQLPRSTLYYTPSKAYSNKDLLMMRHLDTLHLEDPTRGTRRMRNELSKPGFKVGRRHVRTLMCIMRLKTVYCRPRTTIIDPTKYQVSVLATES